jgi:hypothetical protein
MYSTSTDPSSGTLICHWEQDEGCKVQASTTSCDPFTKKAPYSNIILVRYTFQFCPHKAGPKVNHPFYPPEPKPDSSRLNPGLCRARYSSHQPQTQELATSSELGGYGTEGPARPSWMGRISGVTTSIFRNGAFVGKL